MSGDMERIEIRCPVGSRLFGIMVANRQSPVITSDNLIEFKCENCTKYYQRKTGPCRGVYHYYNIIGEFVETFVEK